MTNTAHISQEDLALHAMQALSREESALLRVHLEDCEACRAQLAELEGDLALVAISVDQHAVPDGARARFLDRLAAMPGQPAVYQPTAEVSNVVPMRAAGASRMALWVSWAAVAAMLLVAVGLEMNVRSLRNELQRQSMEANQQAAAHARAQEVLDVLSAPGAQHVVLTAAKQPPAPTAHAVYVPARGALLLEANNLAPLPEGKAYELWVIPANGKAPVPAGLFRPDSAGSAELVLPKIAPGIDAKAFGITVEKASGSDTPTSPIVLSGAAPASGE